MKGKILKLRNLLTMAIIVACLIGCGDQKNTTAEPTTEVEEPTVTEKPAETVEPTDEADSEKVEEKEEPKQEEVVEEPTEETSNEMPEAQVTTTVADITEFAQYMASVDPTTPHIVIWNEAQGYVINMGEGEYYQLKADDKIFLNWNTNIKEMSYSIPEESYESTAEAIEITPDYSKFDNPHECRYKVVLADDPSGERIKLTCYLDAPAE